jgi:hypothetical protein
MRTCANCGHDQYQHGSSDGCRPCAIPHKFCRTFRERESRGKGPFILRAMRTKRKPGSNLTFWDGCVFMSAQPTVEFCDLPGTAKRFRSRKAATRGIVEWALRCPSIIGKVQVVNMALAWA